MAGIHQCHAASRFSWSLFSVCYVVWYHVLKLCGIITTIQCFYFYVLK